MGSFEHNPNLIATTRPLGSIFGNKSFKHALFGITYNSCLATDTRQDLRTARPTRELIGTALYGTRENQFGTLL